jgi:methionine biosynthesis protein MetW
MTDGHGLTSLEKTVYAEMERPDVEALIPLTAQRILDVGCGAGSLGAALKQRGHGVEITGIEMSPALATMAMDRLDHVLVGTVEEHLANLPDRHFDCVVFADVLEHMVNPHQVLLAMRQKLEPDRGIVVASIPNVRHWMVLEQLVLRGRWGYAERGLLDSGHVRFFTLHNIEAMFQWAGYRVHVVDVIGVAPRMLWWVDRILAGKLRPFIVYQYLLTARPADGAVAPTTPWWSGNPNL